MRKVLLWTVVLYLRFWARMAVNMYKVKVIGIAGSVGKSSARNILYAGMREHVSVKNIFGNSETGIPLGILGIKPEGYDMLSWVGMMLRAPFGLGYIKNSEWIVVEMGIDEPYPPRNMEYLLTIVKPDIAISLNVSATHTQQFEVLFNEERYRNVQREERHEFLLEKIAEDDCGIITKSGCSVGIYNADNKYIRDQIDKFLEHETKTKLLSFGKKGNIEYGEYKLSLESTSFSFKSGGDNISLSLKDYVLPEEYKETIAACLLACESVGIDPKKACESIEKNFSLPKGRSTLLKGVNDSVIIDSSYNASGVSTIAFLGMLKKLKANTKRPVVFLFGDMRELGEEAEREHKKVNKYIQNTVDYLYCVGPLTEKFVVPEFKDKKLKEIKWFTNNTEAGEFLRENMPKRALVLVKGSQNTIFLEEAVKQILADENDTSKLCRQEEYWMEIKS